jgi:hypothetical protein
VLHLIYFCVDSLLSNTLSQTISPILQLSDKISPFIKMPNSFDMLLEKVCRIITIIEETKSICFNFVAYLKFLRNLFQLHCIDFQLMRWLFQFTVIVSETVCLKLSDGGSVW